MGGAFIREGAFIRINTAFTLNLVALWKRNKNKILPSSTMIIMLLTIKMVDINKKDFQDTCLL